MMQLIMYMYVNVAFYSHHVPAYVNKKIHIMIVCLVCVCVVLILIHCCDLDWLMRLLGVPTRTIVVCISYLINY